MNVLHIPLTVITVTRGNKTRTIANAKRFLFVNKPNSQKAPRYK